MSEQEKNIGKNVSGFGRLPRATICSLKGYMHAWKYESGFRQYAVISGLLFPFSFVLAQSSTQWLLMIGSLVFLLFSEIVNSAVEAASDAVSKEFNELIGRAKDLGSAGVFTAILFALLTWGIATYQYFCVVS